MWVYLPAAAVPVVVMGDKMDGGTRSRGGKGVKGSIDITSGICNKCIEYTIYNYTCSEELCYNLY